MPEPRAAGAPPPGGPRPPAPPAAGDPGRGPDPADPGPPISVRLNDLRLGDLGHPRVDAKLLTAIVMLGGEVGSWLRARGVTPERLEPPPVIRRHETPLAPGVRRATPEDIAALERHDAELREQLGRLAAAAAAPRGRPIAAHLDALELAGLGSTPTDARLLSAIVVRGGAITAWLTDRIGDADDVESAFPGSSWT